MLLRFGIPTALLLASPAGLPGQSAPTNSGFSNFVELRLYTTRAGVRDRFLEYFEEHYLESQEVVNARVWGQFRDLETPTRFVWVRGFRSMEERLAGLQQFYGSVMWRETGPEVRAMLAAPATHVHFLEPASGNDGFPAMSRPPLASEVNAGQGPGVVVVQLFKTETEAEVEKTLHQLRTRLVPTRAAQGAVSLGLFVSSQEENNFPSLPFIENEPAVIWFSSFPSRAAYEATLSSVPSQLVPFETLVLEPGPRSRMRHR